MRVAALLLCSLGPLLVWGQREGNFKIRFEPKAVLQTGVQIPFEISVNDALKNPVAQAKVTLQIETAEEHTQTKVFPAPAVTAGVYVAKPIFPSAGQWSVYVEVHRGDQVSSRTIQFNVAE